MKKVLISILAITLMLVAANTTLAGKVPTPETPPEGVSIISADDAQKLVNTSGVQVFDMRKALNYGKGHIPGAASLPYKWTKKGDPRQREGKFNMSKLPDDKSQKILFHSDGPFGWKSYYASKAAIEAGYTDVMWMREGYSTWLQKGYSVEH